MHVRSQGRYRSDWVKPTIDIAASMDIMIIGGYYGNEAIRIAIVFVIAMTVQYTANTPGPESRSPKLKSSTANLLSTKLPKL